jgi:DNA repair photolyase
MKTFNGKAIYNPSGKAGEYSYWACNFYTGCSNNCDYCYCKRGVMSSVWSTTPTLKKCFKDENHALEVFEKELKANLRELQKHGLFFSFTTDPMLSETKDLTMDAIIICIANKVPLKILTKSTEFIDDIIGFSGPRSEWEYSRNYIAVGFTLTGHDELEPNASTNSERIEAMRKLHEAGFKTWASIEPVIDIDSSITMIDDVETAGCDLFKIGLESGKKYDKKELESFVKFILKTCTTKIYFKDSLLKQAGISRSELPNNCVDRDYNMFND